MEEFDKDLLKLKESKFIMYMEEASLFYQLQNIPHVVFCDEYTPSGSKAIACIDIDSWIIYVSRIHLKELPFEKVKESAYHEVTHLLNASHDTSFRNKLDDTLTTTWKPENTSGIIMKIGNTRLPEINLEPLEIDMVYCNYHLCRKEVILKQCPHCEKYFCEEHLTPSLPSMPNFDQSDKSLDWKRGIHHPCPPYYDYLCEQERIQLQQIDVVFSRMQKHRYEISHNRWIAYKVDDENKTLSETKEIDADKQEEKSKEHIPIENNKKQLFWYKLKRKRMWLF